MQYPPKTGGIPRTSCGLEGYRGHMRRAISLVTIADLDYNSSDKNRVSVSARLSLLLESGNSLLLLDDRGFSTTQRWSEATVDEIKADALSVVGPDEALEDQSDDEAAEEYWEYLSEILEQQDFDIEPAGLRELPHEVRLSQRLIKRLDAATPAREGLRPRP